MRMKLFDLHCDTLTECYRKGERILCASGDWDIARGIRYSPWCQVFAVWLPDTIRGEQAWEFCQEVLQFAHTQANVLANRFRFVRTAQELEKTVAEGVCAGVLGIEGGAVLAGKPERVKWLAEQGVRVMTITWNGDNELGHGCLSNDLSGLTPVGKQVINEMERYGIVPDVSHLNEAGFWDVAATAKRPFIASHSVSKAVHSHPRNLTDEQFCAIRDHKGLVGLTLDNAQLGEQTFDCVYRHVSHYWALGGEDTVAFGFDLDGTPLPASWWGGTVAEQLTEYLLSRGIPQATVEKLIFDNAYRFFTGI